MRPQIYARGGVETNRFHDVAARTLDAFREATAEAVTVDIFRLDGEQIPAAAGSHMSAEAAAELVAAIPGTLIARERVRMGIPAAISDAEWRTVLYDYDVEVAQFVMGSDPTVTIIRSGLEVAVRVCLLYTSPSPRDKRQSRMPSSA